MKKIANLLFEAKILKEIPRSGYHFLGAGKESVAEHSFSTTFIAYVMSHSGICHSLITVIRSPESSSQITSRPGFHAWLTLSGFVVTKWPNLILWEKRTMCRLLILN